jgi:glycosyltransferase involved in cell wall biosynthesis
MNVGGPAIQVTNLLTGLPSSSFDQVLLTGFCGENETDYLIGRGEPVKVKRVKHLGRAIRPWSDIFALLEIYLTIREFKPDIIHTHTFKAGLLGRVAALLSCRRIKLVHTFHGHLLFGYFGILATKVLVVIERILAQRTDRLVAVGARVRDELIEAGIGNVNQFEIINPGFEMKSEAVISKLELGLPANSFVCGWFGRITQIKRLDRILEIASELKFLGINNISIMIVGDGELRSKFEREATEKQLPLIFLGWRHDITSLMQICDIVLCTSDNEGTPISLIEAQLMGKPVVSTNVGSVSEVLISEKTGFVRDYEVKEFTSRVLELARESSRYKKFSEDAQEFANRKFTLSRFINNHAKLYEEVLAIEPI